MSDMEMYFLVVTCSFAQNYRNKSNKITKIMVLNLY